MFPVAYLEFLMTTPVFFELVDNKEVNEMEYCALITPVKVSLRAGPLSR